MSVDDASALENTLLRLRQRYTLFFSLPENERGRDPHIQVALADATGGRYAGSEVRFRRVFNNADGSNTADPVVVSRTPASGRSSSPPPTSDSAATGLKRRRPAVNEDGTRIENPTPSPGGGWRKSDESGASPAAAPSTAPSTVQPLLTPAQTQPKADTPLQQQGGWRRVKPGEQP
jgi:hypothetical protein